MLTSGLLRTPQASHQNDARNRVVRKSNIFPASFLVDSVANRDQWKNNGSASQIFFITREEEAKC
jgi:hypothetical protein